MADVLKQTTARVFGLPNANVAGAFSGAVQSAGQNAVGLGQAVGNLGQVAHQAALQNINNETKAKELAAWIDLQQAKELSESRLAKAVTDTGYQMQQAQQEYNASYQGEPEGYMPGLLTKLDSIRKSGRDSLQGQHEQEQFDLHTTSSYAQNRAQGFSDFLQLRNSKSLLNVDTASKLSDQTLATNNTLGAASDLQLQNIYQQSLKQDADFINSQQLPEEAKDKLFMARRNEKSVLMMQTIAAQNPQKALDLMNQGVYFDLDGDKIPGFRAQLETQIHSAQVQQAKSVFEGLMFNKEDYVNQVISGNSKISQEVDSQLQAAVTSPLLSDDQRKQALQLHYDLDAAKRFAPLVANVRNGSMTASDLQTALQVMDPDNHPGQVRNYEAEKKIYTRVASLIHNQLQAGDLGFDPATGRPYTTSELQAKGLPLTLPTAKLQEAKNAMKQAYSSNGVDGLVQFGQSLKQQYGQERLGIILNQLTNDPDLSQIANKETVYALKIGDPTVQRAAIQAATTTVEELSETYARSNGQKPGDAINSLKNGVEQNPAFKAFSANPALMSASINDVNQMRNLVTKTALVMMKSGMAPNTAIEQAVKQIIPGKANGLALFKADQYDEHVRKANAMLQNAGDVTDKGNPITRALMNVNYTPTMVHLAAGILGKYEKPVPQLTGFTDTPVTISSGFGSRNAPKKGASSFHQGVDIPVPSGSRVYAPLSGEVVFAGPNGNAGNTVKIRMDDGRIVGFSHLQDSTISVRQGQRVDAHDVLASAGSTGTSTGPHIHLFVEQDGCYINPEPLIKGNAPASDPYRQQQLMQKVNIIRQNSGASLIAHPQLQLIQTGAGAALGTAKAMGLYNEYRTKLAQVANQPSNTRAVQDLMTEYAGRIRTEINQLPVTAKKQALSRFNDFFNAAKGDTPDKAPDWADRLSRNQDVQRIKQYGKFIRDPEAPGEANRIGYQDVNGQWRYAEDVNGVPIRIWNKDLESYDPTYRNIYTNKRQSNLNQSVETRLQNRGWGFIN